MFKFIYWLSSMVILFQSGGTKSTMSQSFDAIGQYNYKSLDTATTARLDSSVFFAPTNVNTTAQITYGFWKNSNASNVDSVKLYINGKLYRVDKVTTTEKTIDQYYTPSKAINPNRVVLKWKVATGGTPNRIVYLRADWVVQN